MLNRQSKELNRKFQNADDKKPLGFNPMYYSINSPIPTDAFPQLSYKNLVNALKNIPASNTHFNEREENFTLAQAFAEALRKYPKILIPIYERLVEEDIPVMYKVFGLEVMINDNMDFENQLRHVGENIIYP